MSSDLPRCATCRVSIKPGERAAFRRDGRVQHLACPEVVCPVCARPVRPTDPIRRDGELLLHGNCWMRRARAAAGREDDAHRAAGIRARLMAGILPSTAPTGMSSGYGSGAACDACGERIAAGKLEYEVNFSGSPTLRVHPGCLALWEEERLRRQGEISAWPSRPCPR